MIRNHLRQIRCAVEKQAPGLPGEEILCQYLRIKH